MEKYLINTAALMGFRMTREQAEKFRIYHEMLLAANREMNLTRVSEEMREACDRNYLDSLTLLNCLGGAKNLIDVGSGAGFPGVPLAIMRPDIRITLLDSLGKRVDFLQSAIDTLNLNACAVHMRCEDAVRQNVHREQYDIAAARAVASLDVLSEWLLPFVKVGGRMLALKGPSAAEEAKNAEYAIETLGGELERITGADIPGRDWQHRIVSIAKISKTPDKFPRKAGIAEKRPLKK